MKKKWIIPATLLILALASAVFFYISDKDPHTFTLSDKGTV